MPKRSRAAEPGHPLDLEAMRQAIADFLRAAGVDLAAAELAETPERVAHAWSESFLDGYATEPSAALGSTYPAGEGAPIDGPVLLKDVPFHGLCPHHLLPFRGRAHLAYLPGEKLASLSGLARLVDCFAHRLEIQEVVTRRIAEALSEHLGARGAAVALDTDQTCMTMRHPERGGARTVTQHFTGAFAERSDLRSQFLSSLQTF